MKTETIKRETEMTLHRDVEKRRGRRQAEAVEPSAAEGQATAVCRRSVLAVAGVAGRHSFWHSLPPTSL
jgi:hypothetical protein